MDSFTEKEIQHILNNLKTQPKHTEPYEHFTLHNFFTDDMYSMLLEDYENVPFEKEKLRSKICNFWEHEILLPELPSTKIMYTVFHDPRIQKALVDSFEIKRSQKMPGKNVFVEFDRFQHKFFYPIHPDAYPKLVSMIIYLPSPDDNAPESLGTRVYDKDKQLVKTASYSPNTGMIFAPYDNLTFHSMQNGEIQGAIRKSVQIFFGYDKFPKRSYFNPPPVIKR